MLIDPPHSAWYRADEQPPTGPAASAALRRRDVATARAISAYLATRAPGAPRTTLRVEL